MRCAVIRETEPTETRVAASPESVAALTRLAGCEVAVEAGLGRGCRWDDDLYRDAGATVISSRRELLDPAKVVLGVQPPSDSELEALRSGTLRIGFLDPFNRLDMIDELAAAGVNAVSLEMVPRTTRFQKLDALSSQHSVSGYYMGALAAERLGKVLPMMGTPAGTIHPARVLVIGAGVAGLQAIATAKRLGARVEAFDTRPVVKEQVQSLGAKFVEVDLGETGEAAGGYAKELTDEQKAKQQAGLADACGRADVVITTAALFGRPAPIVVTKAMLAGMKPGSLVIDYAVSSGGNVEGSVADEEVEIDGVRVIGFSNFPAKVPVDASRMYANNLAAFVREIWDAEARTVRIDSGNELLSASLITFGGRVVNEMIRQRIEGEDA
ncbi:MAG: NAD(P) transhydrogenase subunit alpha [Phycisphaerales bacterium]